MQLKPSSLASAVLLYSTLQGFIVGLNCDVFAMINCNKSLVNRNPYERLRN